MAKVALIGDTHFGWSNSNDFFLNYQESFFRDLIPLLKEEGVTDLIHLGDVYDVRKYINFKALKKSFGFFTEILLASGMNIHLIVGNHDTYYKNTLEINAINELLGWTDFNIYETAEEIKIDSMKFLMVPWICSSNHDEIMSMIDNSEADICCGHFDISGFYMMRNVVNQGGMPANTFSKFKRTFSGHFHIPSESNNIIYVGTPYELSWADYGDKKRIMILDTCSNKLEVIENPFSIFEKIFFKKGIDIPEGNYYNKIIKIYVNQEDNGYDFDLFVKKVKEQEPHLLNIIENVNVQEDSTIHEFIKKDTLEFLTEYIEETAEENSFELKVLMKELYNRALELK